jgi:SiaC family regulatory phosphoprotein
MSDIKIPGSRQTPEIDFQFSSHRLLMAGEAYPENAVAFFTPLTQATAAYLAASGGAPVQVVLGLRYMNSASTKMVFQFLGVLDQAASQGRKVMIEFRHDPDDDTMIEFAEDMRADYPWLNFNLVEMA